MRLVKQINIQIIVYIFTVITTFTDLLSWRKNKSIKLIVELLFGRTDLQR